MEEKNYFLKLELKSVLEIKKEIDKILILKNKYFIVKSLNEIEIYSIDTNKLKFKIPLDEDISFDKKHYNFKNVFIFDYNYKLRLINNEEKINIYKLLTDKYLIEINLNNNKWKIINKLEKGIYIYNLDVLVPKDYKVAYILDQQGKLKNQIEGFDILYGLYEIKGKYLIINDNKKFRIFDINNYKMLGSKKNSYYPWGYKHPYILDDRTIIFSSLLNIYINKSEKYIFVDLNNFSKKYVENIPYNEDDYDTANKLFIIHKFEENIYLQYEISEGKKWSIVKEKNNKLTFIKKFDDKNMLGDNLYFLSKDLLIAWNFRGKTIKFVHYQ